MNNRFKGAVVISVLVHLILITPLYGFAIFRDSVDIKKPMVVDYVLIQDPKKIEIPRSIVSQNMPGAQSIKASVKGADVDARAVKDACKLPGARKVAPGKSSIANKTEAKIRATKEYVSYYQLIRGKIRNCIKDNYKTSLTGGAVRVYFTLKADGSLVSIEGDGSIADGSQGLLGVVAKSIRQAAPFPEFPQALALPRMTFDLVVNFKRQ
jgi:hypothetical protein